MVTVVGFEGVDGQTALSHPPAGHSAEPGGTPGFCLQEAPSSQIHRAERRREVAMGGGGV